MDLMNELKKECLCIVGGSQSAWGEPTQTWGEHKLHTDRQIGRAHV